MDAWRIELFVVRLSVARLRDDSAVVRKNSIMVLTHLILNDMVKVRGQICSMALCLKDSQPSIVEMANMFFCELSVKVCEYILYIYQFYLVN